MVRCEFTGRQALQIQIGLDLAMELLTGAIIMIQSRSWGRVGSVHPEEWFVPPPETLELAAGQIRLHEHPEIRCRRSCLHAPRRTFHSPRH